MKWEIVNLSFNRHHFGLRSNEYGFYLIKQIQIPPTKEPGPFFLAVYRVLSFQSFWVTKQQNISAAQGKKKQINNNV